MGYREKVRDDSKTKRLWPPRLPSLQLSELVLETE